MAKRAFKRDELRLLPSDHDAWLEEHSSGVRLAASDGSMSIIITSAEPRWSTGFVT